MTLLKEDIHEANNHTIVSTPMGSEHYVSILSFVDKDLLESCCLVLLHYKVCSVIRVTIDYMDSLVTVMKVKNASHSSLSSKGIWVGSRSLLL